MRLASCFRFAVLAAALLLFPALAKAQGPVKCESNDGRRAYCGRYEPNQVRLDKQFGNAPCVQGRSWGVDNRGLWVDNGCRASFAIVRGPGGPGPGGPVGPGGGPGAPGSPWWGNEPIPSWPPRGDWHGGNWNKGGACFFADRNFGGSYFCMRRGEVRDYLGPYSDQISSIRVFGGARAYIFEDRGFGGASLSLRSDAPSLGSIPVAQRPGHSWNDRVSSIRVQ